MFSFMDDYHIKVEYRLKMIGNRKQDVGLIEGYEWQNTSGKRMISMFHSTIG